MNIYKVSLRDEGYNATRLTIMRSTLADAMLAVIDVLKEVKGGKNITQVEVTFDSKVAEL